MSNQSKTQAKPNTYKFKNFYSLLSCAYSAAADIEAGDEVISRFLHFAMEGYREFNFDSPQPQIKVAEIEMKAWKEIDFPCDMVDWSLVGFKCGNTIKTLTNDRYIPKTNDRINCVPQENKPCPDIAVAPVGDFIPFYQLHGASIGADGFLPQLYGNVLDYNFLGYFDADYSNRVIRFKETIPNHTKVYLEFIGDGINHDGETIIRPEVFKTIKNYIHWQRKEHDERFSLSDRDRAQRLYNQSMQDTLVRMLNLTLDDIKEALWSGRTQSPKA